MSVSGGGLVEAYFLLAVDRVLDPPLVDVGLNRETFRQVDRNRFDVLGGGGHQFVQ